ncbi:MAG: hypothetical protein HY929_09310 [Euryarchaeota archaeon]|nr:hypothetical protein [Euryarchaeota archaeon]
MSEVFESKTLKIGNSIGVLIPKELVEKEKITIGEPIKLAIVSREKLKAIERTFGSAKGKKGFIRLDNLNRDI